MSKMLSIIGPTLALYLLCLIFYTTVETIRSLRGEDPKGSAKKKPPTESYDAAAARYYDTDFPA
jgi:hypothetical protein